MARNPHQKLTPEQRRAVWAKTDDNAGMGWSDPFAYRRSRAFDPSERLDDYERQQRMAEATA